MRFCEVDGEERPAPIDRVSLMDMASCRVTRTLNRVGVGGRGGCIKRRRRKKKETRRVKGADFFFFFLQRAQPVLHKFLSVFRHANQCSKFTSLLLLLSHAFI